MSKETRNHKDSLFTTLFQTSEFAPQNFLDFYNSVHGTNLKLENTKVEPFRIEKTLFSNLENDASMLIDNKLIVLIEHQSTINLNMPLRCLMYIGRLYEMLTEQEDRYRKQLIKIPTPEFYVVYNGPDTLPAITTLKLSDAYIKEQKIQLELEIPVFNLNRRSEINEIKNCKALNDYSNLVEIMRKYIRSKTEGSYEKGIQEAISRNILKDFLSKFGSEVYNMFWGEYDYDTDIRVQRQEEHEIALEEGIALGLEKGKTEGRAESKLQDAVIAVKELNATPEKASELFEVPLKDLQKALQN